MNKNFLGDALDHWKGSLLGRLEQRGLGVDIHVVPMLTRVGWNKQFLTLYADLLHRRHDQVLLADEVFESRNRESYFAKVEWTGDLFLDPDTGLGQRRGHQHVVAADLRQLLDGGDEDRIIMVYQHAWRTSNPHGLIKRIAREVEAHALSMVSSQVEMVVFCRDKAKTDRLLDALTIWLECAPRARVLAIR